MSFSGDGEGRIPESAQRECEFLESILPVKSFVHLTTRHRMTSDHLKSLFRAWIHGIQQHHTLRQLKAHQELMGMETEYVFASERTGAPLSNQVFLMMLRRAGYGAIPGKPARMTGHGWRGLFSTWAHESGYEHHVIESCLSHTTKGAVEAAYNFAQYAKKRDELMQTWADALDTLENEK